LRSPVLENFGLFLLLGARVLRGFVGFVDFGCFLRAGFLVFFGGIGLFMDIFGGFFLFFLRK